MSEKKPKLLAEWFWGDRWTGSSAFLLPIAARGLYREMLTQAWIRGAKLPNDHQAIRRATGVSTREWNANWKVVEPYWVVDGSHLVNRTQESVYLECFQRAERAQARGQAGAQAKHKHLLKQVLKHKPPSPSLQITEPPLPKVGNQDTDWADECQSIWVELRGGDTPYIFDLAPAYRKFGSEILIPGWRAYLESLKDPSFPGSPRDFASKAGVWCKAKPASHSHKTVQQLLAESKERSNA